MTQKRKTTHTTEEMEPTSSYPNHHNKGKINPLLISTFDKL